MSSGTYRRQTGDRMVVLLCSPNSSFLLSFEVWSIFLAHSSERQFICTVRFEVERDSVSVRHITIATLFLIHLVYYLNR